MQVIELALQLNEVLPVNQVFDAVVGVTINGEESPRAYVVRKEKSSVTEEEVARWMADKVARYKQLRGGVKFIDAIPKNPVSLSCYVIGGGKKANSGVTQSGKILRKILRDQAQKEVGDAVKKPSKI